MRSLYNRLRDKNVGGIPYREAVQLFLWVYCTNDILPSDLKHENTSRENLVEIFSKLTADNIITNLPSEFGNVVAPRLNWDGLVTKLLSKDIHLDPEFPKRIAKFF